MNRLLYVLKCYYLEGKQQRAMMRLLDAETALYELHGKPKDREDQLVRLHDYIAEGVKIMARDMNNPEAKQ